MTQVAEKTTSYEEQKFDFDEDVVEALTHGDCWFLAAALKRRLNMPYVVIFGDGVMQHVAVELPNGNIVDIEGVWDPSDWEGYWYDELDDVWEIYAGEPDEDDENHYLLYPTDDSEENVGYGSEDITLAQIADRIVALLHP